MALFTSGRLAGIGAFFLVTSFMGDVVGGTCDAIGWVCGAAGDLVRAAERQSNGYDGCLCGDCYFRATPRSTGLPTNHKYREYWGTICGTGRISSEMNRRMLAGMGGTGVMIVGFAGVLVKRSNRLADPSMCQECGYLRNGLPVAAVCPECGQAPPSSSCTDSHTSHMPTERDSCHMHRPPMFMGGEGRNGDS